MVEFQPIDFTGRDWLPESRWPVGYEEIAPYYRQTYAAFGIGEAEQDDQQVWKAVGTPPAPLPGGLEVFLTRRLKVPSFSVYFADTINSSADILLLADHVAVGFDGSGTRVEAVKGRRPVADGATTGS